MSTHGAVLLPLALGYVTAEIAGTLDDHGHPRLARATLMALPVLVILAWWLVEA